MRRQKLVLGGLVKGRGHCKTKIAIWTKIAQEGRTILVPLRLKTIFGDYHEEVEFIQALIANKMAREKEGLHQPGLQTLGVCNHEKDDLRQQRITAMFVVVRRIRRDFRARQCTLKVDCREGSEGSEER